MQPEISVVIPTHNRWDALDGCIHALLKVAPDSELVVSDDGSTDDTQARVKRLAMTESRVRLVTGPKAGPAVARNRGWRAARGQIIAFIDDDCVPERGWLQELVRRLNEESALSGVEGRTMPAAAGSGFFVHTLSASGGAYLTCNIAFRRAALERVGGFDERFRFAAAEDLDLAFRIMETCGPIGYVPEAVVYHSVAPVGPRHYFRRVKYDSSIFRLFARHPTRFPAANKLVRVPLYRPVDSARPPSFPQIFLYFLSYRLHHAYRCLRDGKSLRERLVGSATYLACILLSVVYAPSALTAYREALPRQ